MNGANVTARLVRHSPGESGWQATRTKSGADTSVRQRSRGEPLDKLGALSLSNGGTPPASATLRFNIGRLTLPGMSRADTARVVAAMKKDLAKLASQFPGRNWQDVAAIDRLDGGTLRAGARPEQIGEHLAAQIFRRLSP
jgi:hypothetical protein